jgi:hypothetical protein
LAQFYLISDAGDGQAFSRLGPISKGGDKQMTETQTFEDELKDVSELNLVLLV